MAKVFKWLLVGFSVLGIVALIGYLLVISGWFQMNVPNESIYPVRGIDVSHHQGAIEWQKVAGEGIEFAFVKVSEGGDHRDKMYAENIKEASKHGIDVSPYHYYSFCKNPKEQFDNFISALDLSLISMPVTIDLEYDNNCNGSVSVAKLQKDLEYMVDLIAEETGRFPILYCNEGFQEKYLSISSFEKCTFWVRNTIKEPKLSGNFNWMFWQYSAIGSVSGIDGDVDLNVFKGTQDEFILFVQNQ